jgi:hypothetical protein
MLGYYETPTVEVSKIAVIKGGTSAVRCRTACGEDGKTILLVRQSNLRAVLIATKKQITPEEVVLVHDGIEYDLRRVDDATSDYVFWPVCTKHAAENQPDDGDRPETVARTTPFPYPPFYS